MPKRYVRIRCPRCHQQSCIVWPHEHNRFVCHQTCPRFEARCDNPKCEYPSPAGLAEWTSKHGDVVWDGPRGGHPDAKIAAIMESPIEPLPPPYI